MMSDVHEEFRAMLTENSWMDESTKKLALKKVDEMVHLVGSSGNTTNATALTQTYATVSIKWSPLC